MHRAFIGIQTSSVAKWLLPICLLALWPLHGGAQPEVRTREYTQDYPLIYEDVWDLWPYSFLNDSGQPDGFNIDLVKLIFERLNIPYVIKMKSMQEAYEDLKTGKSDMMMGLAVGFHDEYGRYGRNSITLFTQSTVAPRGKTDLVTRFRDLGNHQVYVVDGSLTHHLMIDYGWEQNAIPVTDMKETILRISEEEKGIIVWNTLSLKWLLRKYQIDNLELTPVDMPHGEYKFMSNDPVLLNKVDSVYTILNAAERVVPIQNKWFYPERHDKVYPQWVWYLMGFVGIVALLLLYYFMNYRIRERRVRRQTALRNNRLALILETSNVRMWTYELATQVFTWRNENGQAAYNYTPEEFAHRYHEGDFNRLMAAIGQLASSTPPEDGEEAEIKLDIKARDDEDGDAEERDFFVALSVLHRDKKGHALTILGTKRDVTDERRQQRLDRERELRYWAIFNTPMVGITFYNRYGILSNINQKACEIFQCNRDDIIKERVSFHDIYSISPEVSIEEVNGYYATHIINLDRIPKSERKVHSIKRKGKLYQEVRMMTVYDNSGEVIGLYGIARDVTDRVESIARQDEIMEQTQKTNNELTEYVQNIDYTLQAGSVRLASYSPDSHTLTIYNGINTVQHSLTQARCMTLIDDSSKKKAMRMLNNMDNCVTADIDTDVRTNLRVKNGYTMHLNFHFMPLRDKHGKVTEYFGLCRDVTELKAIEQLTRQQTAKAQEVENAQNSFLKNMSYEIRTPLNTVVGFAELFEMDHSPEDEKIFVNEILDNSDKLLHLINSILFLSRIDAGMVEIDRQPSDFAAVFPSQCEDGWAKYKQPDVRYIVENPYEKLVVDIDANNLGHVIHRVAANAAQFTSQGTVRARYDYIGRMLRIAIDDTGCGIPQDRLNAIYKRFVTGASDGSSGLGLPICKELTERMGGQFEISSEEGLGTTVWITIPCHASEIKRKKNI